MTELEALAKDCIDNHTHKLVDKPTKQDVYLREESIYIQGYKECERKDKTKIEELQRLIEYYQAREQESGWTRFNELSHEEFCELNDFLNVAYEENKDIYEEACESVSKVWDRIAVARCGVWEMMFRRMYIQAYRKGKDSEVKE